jgi:hypothetical protein
VEDFEEDGDPVGVQAVGQWSRVSPVRRSSLAEVMDLCQLIASLTGTLCSARSPRLARSDWAEPVARHRFGAALRASDPLFFGLCGSVLVQACFGDAEGNGEDD